MNEKKKIEYYRQSEVVTQFRSRRFQGPAGKWVDETESRQSIQLLGDPGGRCLDLACGQGRLGRKLQQAGWQVVGIDSSGAMLKETRTLRVLGNAFHLPFQTSTFAGVASLRFLFHVDDPDPVFREVSRILVDGGRFVIDPLNWTIRSIFPGVFDGAGGRIHAWPENEMRARGARFNLHLERTEPLFLFPPSVLRFLPLPVVKFLESLAGRIHLTPSRYLALFVKGKAP